MYIKSMVIDGFKSYGQRTEISGFDSEFNAITGLNGSGKSNILDAICFLLGITNLSAVRATNLQELVYKNGQAGVTRATVTLTFDNTDKKQSPLGYEHFDEIAITRQVVIGGKNKYLINGSNIQANRVADFFRSVQLNVNNPHFLIMQGRITKVLNMKPPEILAMIEEAVGTMMYESKKQQAQKTIEKKDSKLKEINDILNEEITPTLSKLRDERNTYLEYQKIQRELEHLTRLHVAFKFVSVVELAQKSKEGLAAEEGKMESYHQEIADGEKQIEAIKAHVEELQRLRDEELGGRLEELESRLSAREKSAAKAETALKTSKDNKKQEEKKRVQIEKGMNTDKKALGEKTTLSEGMQTVYDELREVDRNCTEALKAAQARFEAISVGKFSAEDGSSATLQEQIIKLNEDVTKAQSTIKNNDLKLKHNQKELKKLEVEMKKTEKDYQKDSGNIRQYEEAVQKVERDLAGLNYEEGISERLEEDFRNLRHEIMGMERKADQVMANNQWLDFRYTDPEKNFDRSKVFGVAASLFSVKERKFTMALNIAGGGKLSNVIVASSDVTNKLLKRGNLQRRTTFLPLDTMQSQVIPLDEIRRAQKTHGKENVFRAIDLLEYDPTLQTAMEYLFGTVVVCSNIEVAKKIAYQDRLRSCRLCVTFGGDKINPNGEMSGGSAPQGDNRLDEVAVYRQIRQELDAKKAEAAEMEARLKNIVPLGKTFQQLKHQLDIKARQLEQVRERLRNTAHHQVAEDFKALQKNCEEMEAQIAEARAVEAEGSKKVKDIEYKIKNAKQLKEKELKEAEVDVKKCKKAMEESKSRWSDKEAEEASLKLEISELQKSIADAEEQLLACDVAIKGYEEEAVKMADAVAEEKEEVLKAKQDLKAQKDAVNKNNKEIISELSKSDKISKDMKDNELKIQELRHKIAKAADEAKDADKTVQHMLDKYEWISIDRKYFGEPGSAYDFKASDPREAGKRINKLEEIKDKLERTVNMRAMTMLDKAEVQYVDLKRKKTTVEMDKAKIKKVIEELDRKKQNELRIAWEKVNKDFGSIFSTLLPGAKVKLQPQEGKDALEGLEVKVAFGDVWKESLSELSGGQRSLVALSLILSLLLFKPAPLYILDEVDAALDLSHTQNIGLMLKTHFKSSQFIVVSLKDGMFNNANVLFRTKFVDGMSTVGRTVAQQRK